MNNTVFMHSLLLLTGVFISAVSQVMLKKSAMKNYDKAVTLCPTYKEAWKKIRKLEKDMLGR